MGWDRTDPAQLEQRNELFAGMLHQAEVTSAPNGIGALDLPHLLAMVLVDHELWTIAQVQKRVADDTIGDVPRIGKGREKVLREALASWGEEHTAERALDELDDNEEGED
jgi:hypothetical protein